MAEAALAPPNEPIVENGNGFSPDEQAAFDAMRADSPMPEGQEPPAQPDTPANPEPALAVVPPVTPEAPAPGDEDGDEDDEPAAATPPADGSKPPPRRVAFGKFQRQQEKTRKAEADLAAERASAQALREREARLDERLKLINEALTTPKAEAKDTDPEPDAESDVFGWIQWKKRDDARLRQEVADMRQGRETETADSQLFGAYQQDAEVFAQQEPNFIPAYQHLMQSRTAELAQYFFGKDLYDPATVPLTAQEIGRIKTTVANEEKQLVAEAFKTGTSPAKRIMAMARGRGFNPQAAQPAPQPNPAPQAAAQPPAAAQPAAQPSVKDEIERVKNGQAASLSLSNGGGAPNNPLTAEKLANMPQAEFDRLLNQLAPDEIKALMGGA